MSPPVRPELDRAQWREIGMKAKAALEADPNDQEAREWFARAQQTLQETLPELEADVAEANRRDVEEARPDFSGVGGGIGAAALKAGQGATFGLSDELAGLLAGAAAAVPGGQSPGEAFRGTVTGAREALKGAQEQRPFLSGTADIAGALAMPAGALRAGARGGRSVAQTAGRLLRRPREQRSLLKSVTSSQQGAAPRMLDLVRQGGRVGATQGAGQAAGRTEGNLGERAVAGAVGGTVGGATGAAVPLAATGGRVLARQLKNALGYVARPVTEPVSMLFARGPADDIAASVGRQADEVLDLPTFLRRAGGASPSRAAGATRSAGRAAAATGTAEERAVAKQLGVPIDMVRGRVGQAAGQPSRLARARQMQAEEGFAPSALQRIPSRALREAEETALAARRQQPAITDEALAARQRIQRPAISPAETSRRAGARAQVAEEIATGARGPRGGALVGSKARAADTRIANLARQLRDLPDAQLQAELDNPMVEDFVKQAARQELARRAAT